MRRKKAKTATKTSPTGITSAEVLVPLVRLLDAVGISRSEVLRVVRAVPRVKLRRPVALVRGQIGYWSRLSIRWAADPRFLGSDGRPRDLSFATGDANFSDLVAVELPGERPAACRDTLVALGTIIRLPGGKLRWRDRSALAAGAESGVVFADEYLRPLRALLDVLQTNLLRRPAGVTEGAFQKAVSGFEISREDMEDLKSFVGRHGTALLETVDDWLAEREQQRRRSGALGTHLARPYFCLYLGTDSDTGQSSRATPPQSTKKRTRKKV